MKVHVMNINSVDFEKIRNGEKVIETRLYDEKRQSVSVGDTIVFGSNGEQVNVVVTDLLKYKYFNDLFTNNEFRLFGENSLGKLMTIYKYYSSEDEEKYGVIGIKFSIK